MGSNWLDPKDVLTYLANSPNMQRHLRSMSARIRTPDSSSTLIVHPLLDPPLCLISSHNDAQFKKTIEERLKEECGEADKQVVPYSKPLLLTLTLLYAV